MADSAAPFKKMKLHGPAPCSSVKKVSNRSSVRGELTLFCVGLLAATAGIQNKCVTVIEKGRVVTSTILLDYEIVDFIVISLKKNDGIKIKDEPHFFAQFYLEGTSFVSI